MKNFLNTISYIQILNTLSTGSQPFWKGKRENSNSFHQIHSEVLTYETGLEERKLSLFYWREKNLSHFLPKKKKYLSHCSFRNWYCTLWCRLMTFYFASPFQRMNKSANSAKNKARTQLLNKNRAFSEVGSSDLHCYAIFADLEHTTLV